MEGPITRSAICSASAALLLVSLFGCGDECARALDCASGEVCYLGTCEALSAANTSCVSDNDCNPEGFDLYACRGARCVLKNTTRPDGGTVTGTVADGGVRDSGVVTPNDSGVNDSGVADGGPNDAGPGRDAGLRDGGMGGGMLTVAIDGTNTDFSAGGGPSAVYTQSGTVAGALISGTAANGDTLRLFYSQMEPGAGTDGCGPDQTPGTRLSVTRGQTLYTETACTINITAFGPTGGFVTGIFSGTVMSTGGATLTLTNGQINVLRTQ